MVVDSGSTDGTQEVAASLGAKVFMHPYDSQSDQLNWALENVVTTPWVLIVDADERIEGDIGDLLRVCANSRKPAVAFRRKNYFGPVFLRWGGFWPDWQVRLMRSDLRYEHRPIHAHVEVARDGIEFCREILLRHDAYICAEDYLRKLVRYAIAEADVSPQKSARPKHRALRAFAERVPGRAVSRFLYMYVVRLGFLHGRLGWYLAVWSAEKETMKTGLRVLGQCDDDPLIRGNSIGRGGVGRVAGSGITRRSRRQESGC